MDRKTLACTISCLHCASLPSLILSLHGGVLQVVDVKVEPHSLWCTTYLNKLSLPETLDQGLIAYQTLYDFVIGAKRYMSHAQACCDIFAF